MPDLASIRKEYTQQGLHFDNTAADPAEQLQQWLEQAIAAEVPEPNAMNLATVNAKGLPTSRIVLLKGLEEGGLVFYTNYSSQKGQQMSRHPFAALTFFWPELERQLRVEGTVEKIDPSVSDAYFHSRPRGSQLGAHASPQSQPIDSRTELDDRLRQLESTYGQSKVIPRPEHWGGFVVKPTFYEFWQGRPNRLHDRIAYQPQSSGQWERIRLAP